MGLSVEVLLAEGNSRSNYCLDIPLLLKQFLFMGNMGHIEVFGMKIADFSMTARITVIVEMAKQA